MNVMVYTFVYNYIILVYSNFQSHTRILGKIIRVLPSGDRLLTGALRFSFSRYACVTLNNTVEPL